MSLWVFGYGSLIWKTGFVFQKRELAYIDNWQRRFCQASPDHRGTREYPGRVVTLIPAPAARCYGVAYLLPADGLDQAIEELDYREKNGYERLAIDIHFPNRRTRHTETGIVYHADETNPSFIRNETEPQIAQRIQTSHGPSGSNVEYLHELQLALTELNIEDPHVSQLTQLICDQAFEPPSTE